MRVRDGLFRVFMDELDAVLRANGADLLSEHEALEAYESVRASLSPEQRDAFLRSVLGGVQSIADDDRRALRALIARHAERLAHARAVAT
jgi:hypothetical protein